MLQGQERNDFRSQNVCPAVDNAPSIMRVNGIVVEDGKKNGAAKKIFKNILLRDKQKGQRIDIYYETLEFRISEFRTRVPLENLQVYQTMLEICVETLRSS